MGDFLKSSEVVLGLLVVCVIVALAWIVVRRWYLTHDRHVVLIALAPADPAGAWHVGMARIGSAKVEWFPVLGLSVRPSHTWQRGELELGAPMPPAPRPPAVLQDPVAVKAVTSEGTVRLAMASSDYTVLRSWSESAPPGSTVHLA
ncbi:DUF2550 family protein [Calidifontibacter sp. DB0510]|uniref:DUF2550 family protein n=1 Tax=Metallococcus carri TaxID=1656884 RepID=A0A967B7T6_9MICO|nr:DUF2550 family protein [Metallococcus carri]NHN56351.1 DUF2550 family protein [Metallococcus carri]NOP35975.1 DUF2550 family protein [Calidifontibacter sp. DB2511S]